MVRSTGRPTAILEIQIVGRRYVGKSERGESNI